MEVTQEVRARTLVAESAERLRTVLDEMPVGVNVRDAKTGDVLLSSKASSEILGVDVRDTTNPASWRVWNARHPDGRLLKADEHAFRRVMLTRQSVRNQVVLLKPAGSDEGEPEIVVRSSATVIKGEADHELVISVFEDITDEHTLMAQREQTARFAENVHWHPGPRSARPTQRHKRRRRPSCAATLARRRGYEARPIDYSERQSNGRARSWETRETATTWPSGRSGPRGGRLNAR